MRAPQGTRFAAAGPAAMLLRPSGHPPVQRKALGFGPWCGGPGSPCGEGWSAQVPRPGQALEVLLDVQSLLQPILAKPCPGCLLNPSPCTRLAQFPAIRLAQAPVPSLVALSGPAPLP